MCEVRTIYLVACACGKQTGIHPARSLYVSQWFWKARALAERNADGWYILSAKHGLLHPDREVECYNLSMDNLSTRERTLWAANVLGNLCAYLHPGDTVVILAGERYREHLIAPLRRMGVDVQVPMESMGIGKQLQWMKWALRDRSNSDAMA